LEVTGQVTLSKTITIAGEAASQSELAHQSLTDAVREHSRFVFKVAYSLLRNPADAEDAVQETFLRAMRHVDEFAKVDDQRAWLARTAWRIALDRTRRRPEPSLDDETNGAMLAYLGEIATNSALTHSGAESSLIADQMLALLRSLIAKLPSDLRDVVTLSTVEEMSSSQIAAVLGIPEGSVRTRLLRARNLLKEKLTALLDKRTPNPVGAEHGLPGTSVPGGHKRSSESRRDDTKVLYEP
jgi:RNA polymerase sigma-70 factor, ECF subfamily